MKRKPTGFTMIEMVVNKIVTIVTVGPGLGGTTHPTNNPQAADTFVFRILRR